MINSDADRQAKEEREAGGAKAHRSREGPGGHGPCVQGRTPAQH